MPRPRPFSVLLAVGLALLGVDLALRLSPQEATAQPGPPMEPPLEPTVVSVSSEQIFTDTVGGGFPSSNRLKPFYDVPGGTEFSSEMLAPFGEAILGRLGREKGLFGNDPTLVLEPGRALVDAAAVLLSTVVAKKYIPDHGTGIVLDAGVNLVPTAYWYDHRVETRGSVNMRQRQCSQESVKIFGLLCMQIDVIGEQTQLRSFEVGDAAVISNVGAYCHTMSMQFIQTRPATILLGGDGPEVIQRRETWRDVFLRDKLPNRLRRNGIEF